MNEVFYISTITDSSSSSDGTNSPTTSSTYHHKQKPQDALAKTITANGNIFCLELTGQSTFGYRCCPGVMRDVAFSPKLLVKIVDSNQTGHLIGYHSALSSFFGFSLDATSSVPFLSDAKASFKSFGHERVTTLAASPDGSWVVGGDVSGRLVVWKVGAEGDLAAVCDGAHLQAVSSIVFSTDGNLLATGGADAIIKVWSFYELLNAPDTDKALAHTFTAHSATITSIAFGLTAVNGQGRIMASSADGSVTVFDLCDGQSLARFSFPEPISTSTWSADETLIIAGSQSGAIYLIDLSFSVSNVERQVLQKHHGPVNTMQLSSDERLLISGGSDGLVVFWDLVTKQPIKWHSIPTALITNILADFKEPMSTFAVPSKKSYKNNATNNVLGPFKRIGSEITDLTTRSAIIFAEDSNRPATLDPIHSQLTEENRQLRVINTQLCKVIEKIRKE